MQITVSEGNALPAWWKSEGSNAELEWVVKFSNSFVADVHLDGIFYTELRIDTFSMEAKFRIKKNLFEFISTFVIHCWTHSTKFWLKKLQRFELFHISLSRSSVQSCAGVLRRWLHPGRGRSLPTDAGQLRDAVHHRRNVQHFRKVPDEVHPFVIFCLNFFDMVDFAVE